jgi:aryl-alcohol dehydrogenase-like predicted oxidoreductase
MRYRPLGPTGLEISAVSLGSWLTFGGSVDEQRSIDCIHRAFDLGVNFFDTANVYAMGRAEEVMGRALASLPRDRYLLATKLFFPVGPAPEDSGLSRAAVLTQCDRSLGRLGVDVIDLYQCHRYDGRTPLLETCRAMDELARAGKIRHWGVSEWKASEMADAVALCEREGLAPPVSDQPRYSMLERGTEAEVLPACARLRLGVVVFSPLAQGMLTGKYRSRRHRPSDSRAADPEGRQWIDRFLTWRGFKTVDKLRPIAADLGVSMAQLALAWTLRRPEVTSAITGATRAEQVEDNVVAADLDLDAESVDRVEAALA